MKMRNYQRNTLTFVLATATSLPSLLQCAGMTNPGVSSNLQIHLPLSIEVEYDHREALFGIPPYGEHSIEQNLYHTDDLLCSGAIDTGDKIGPAAVAPFVLMVDRGNCTFVQKVRSAQRSGAVAVIVADNICYCRHEGICTSEEGTKCQEREPLMMDDGSGGDITIPAMLVFKQDADGIKAVLKEGTPVRVEMVWSVPNPNDHVELHLWSRVTDPQPEVFQTMWMEAQAKLGDTVSFTPHYHIYDGLEANCRRDHKNECYNLCTNVGRYCTIDPDNDLDYGISGADVIEESLRRLCIWDIYGSNGSGPEFFRYVQEFMECDTDEKFMNEECIDGALSRVKIDKHRVNQCMIDSGGTETPDVNEVLQHQLEELKASGVIVIPVVYVNGVRIRGALTFDVVFKAVCAGYKEGTQPDICAKCADCTDTGVDSEYNCVVKGYCADDFFSAGVMKEFTGNTIEFTDALNAPTPPAEPLPAPTAQNTAGQLLQFVKEVSVIIIAGVLVTLLFANARYLHIHDYCAQPEGCNEHRPDDYIELTQYFDHESAINTELI